MSVRSVRLARTLSPFRSDAPVPGTSRRSVTTAQRDAEKPNSADKWRYRMTWRGLPCSLCGLSGSWTVENVGKQLHPARMTFGHTIPLTLFGASNIANYTPQHYACNRAAGETDLRGMVEYIADSLPSKEDAIEWRDNEGYRAFEPDSLPTETAMRMGRKGRGLSF